MKQRQLCLYVLTPQMLLKMSFIASYTIDVICNIEIQQAFRLVNPKKIKEALPRALEFEAGKQTSRKLLQVRPTQDSVRGGVPALVHQKNPDFDGIVVSGPFYNSLPQATIKQNT